MTHIGSTVLRGFCVTHDSNIADATGSRGGVYQDIKTECDAPVHGAPRGTPGHHRPWMGPQPCAQLCDRSHSLPGAQLVYYRELPTISKLI